MTNAAYCRCDQGQTDGSGFEKGDRSVIDVRSVDEDVAGLSEAIDVFLGDAIQELDAARHPQLFSKSLAHC